MLYIPYITADSETGWNVSLAVCCVLPPAFALIDFNNDVLPYVTTD